MNHRVSKHVNGDVNTTKEMFTTDKWTGIKALDVTEIIENEMEHRILENTFMYLYEPVLNQQTNRIPNDFSKFRLLELMALVNDISCDWIEIKNNSRKEKNHYVNRHLLSECCNEMYKL